MAGRKRKPTALKKLEGNPGKRPLNQHEPKYDGLPEMPDWLSSAAKKEWSNIVPKLGAVGLLQSVDMAMLVGYCQAWGVYVEAEKTLMETGRTFVYTKYDKNGNVVSEYQQIRPEVTISNNAMNHIIKFCQEFGLSPSSRVRLVTKTEQTESGIEDLLD